MGKELNQKNKLCWPFVQAAVLSLNFKLQWGRSGNMLFREGKNLQISNHSPPKTTKK